MTHKTRKKKTPELTLTLNAASTLALRHTVARTHPNVSLFCGQIDPARFSKSSPTVNQLFILESHVSARVGCRPLPDPPTTTGVII